MDKLDYKVLETYARAQFDLLMMIARVQNIIYEPCKAEKWPLSAKLHKALASTPQPELKEWLNWEWNAFTSTKSDFFMRRHLWRAFDLYSSYCFRYIENHKADTFSLDELQVAIKQEAAQYLDKQARSGIKPDLFSFLQQQSNG